MSPSLIPRPLRRPVAAAIFALALALLAGCSSAVIDQNATAAPRAPAAYVEPLTMRYVVPPGVPIVLWNSAVRGRLDEGETLEAFAARMNAPAWAIASINNVDAAEPPAPGTALLVPRSSADLAR